MTTTFRPRTPALFLGDIFFFAFSLWVSLFLRAFEVPTGPVFAAHLVPFSLLFVVWVGVFFIIGLYESRSILLARRALSSTLLTAQVLNLVIAALFFFLVPIFGIAPKTLLFIYLVVSFLLVLFWRAVLFPWLGLQKAENALVVGSSPEIDEMIAALGSAYHAPARVAGVIAPVSNSLAAMVVDAVEQSHPRFIIADFHDPRVSAAFPELYNFLLQGIRFLDSALLYEEVFGRVPLSLVDPAWLARNVSRSAHVLYDPLKRSIDVSVALVLGVLSLVLYPFIAFAIYVEDGGSIFITQERIGEGGRPFRIYKFRTMTGNDNGKYGAGGTKLVVTRVGHYLRISRLDELPQLWNVLMGKLSLIGPRPELPALVATYEKEIPFYAVRHLIKPGLSGSAQLYYHGDPHHAADVESTRMKLSYDLFYVKHRSLSLDLSIGIKTIRRILTRSNA